ncbi:hypothetical protein G210_5930 [Candida maltosa Xu316]|uniref:histidine kinase n=1 Tax=Candida maltosa (strain Xu316) TaxID=1245528 RepID=M3HTG6_CANMX|nr:hypothetical protein G210_5930 [Candida maltosa Xu316]
MSTNTSTDRDESPRTSISSNSFKNGSITEVDTNDIKQSLFFVNNDSPKPKNKLPVRPTRISIPNILQNTSSTESSSEPPSALSLNLPMSPRELEFQHQQLPMTVPAIPLNEYSLDQTLSPKGIYEEGDDFNIHQSMASLMEDCSSYVSHNSNDDCSTTASSERSSKVSLGNPSYLNNINYMRSHLEYLSKNVNRNLSPPRLSPISTDSIDLMGNSIPGYTIIKKFGAEYQTNLLYKAIKDSHHVENGTLKQFVSTAGPLELNSPVLIRLSPNIYKNISVSRFLNEWYLLSGTNVVKEHRIWSNETLSNKYVSATKTRSFDKEAARKRGTLPTDIPGILYPQEVINFEMIEDDSQLKDPLEIIAEKRCALIYYDNEYKTLKDCSTDIAVEFLERQGSVSTNDSTRRSIASFDSNGSIPDSFEHFRFGGSDTNSDFIFRKLNKSVRASPKHAVKVIEILSDIIQVVETLALVHELGFVHNGITSHNLVKSMKDKDVKITGWGFAFSYHENSSYGYRKRHLNQIPDLISYMAPEVAGLINRVVDYRADFYSLGVVMYELLLGILPLNGGNAQSIVRQSTFNKPIEPSQVAPWVSANLSAVIMKLLEKNPADRYNEGYSLLHDLITVKNVYIDKLKLQDQASWNHLSKTESYSKYLVKQTSINRNKIGQSPVLKIYSRFIGREDFYSDVLCKYDEYCKGVHLLVLAGESGSGKSLILDDLHSKAVLKYDFYCTFKFTISTTENYIYKFLVDGVQKIINQILECSEEVQNSWRDLIVKNIPLDMSILFYLIPELRQLLGVKYTSIFEHKSSISGLGVEYRDDQTSRLEIKFRRIITTFYKLVASQGLTIFLDDLHWCSEESWMLFCDILDFEDSEVEDLTELNVKIVATYCTNADQLNDMNVDVNMENFLKYAAKSKMEVHKFDVPKIAREAAIDVMMESTSFSSTQYSELPREHSMMNDCIRKAYGELYDVSEGSALSMMYAIRVARLSGVSIANFPDISRHSFLENGEKTKDDILTSYLNFGSNHQARSLLEYAAIISKSTGFYLSDLVVAASLPMNEVFELLQVLVASKIIIPTSTYYKVPFHLLCSDETPFDFTDDEVWELASLCSYRFYHDSICAHVIKEMNASSKFAELSRLCGLRFYATITKEKSLNIGGYLQMTAHFRNSYTVARPEENEKYVEVLVQGGRYALSTYNTKLSQWFFEVIGELVYNLDSKTQLKAILTVAQNHFNFGEFEKCLKVLTDGEKKFKIDKLLLSLILVKVKIELGELKEAYAIGYESLKALGVPIYKDKMRNKQQLKKILGAIPLSVPEIRGILDKKHCTNSKASLIYQLISELIPPLRILEWNDEREVLVAYVASQISTHGSSPYCALIMFDFASRFVTENTPVSMIQAKEYCAVGVSLINRGAEVSLSYVQSIYNIHVCCYAAFFEPMDTVLNYLRIANDATMSDRLASDTTTDSLIAVSKYFITRMSGKVLPLKAEEQLSAKTIVSHSKDPISQLCYYVVILEDMQVNKKILTYCSKGSETEERMKSEILQHHMEQFKMWAEVNPATFSSKYLILLAMDAIRKNADKLEILDLFDESIQVAHQNKMLCDVCWNSLACARWLVMKNRSAFRIKKMAKVGLDILKRLEMKKDFDFYKLEFEDYLDDDHQEEYEWAGIKNFNNDSDDNLQTTGALSKKTSLPSSTNLATKTKTRIIEDYQSFDLGSAIRECLSISEALDEKGIATELLSAALNFSSADFGVVVTLRNEEPMLQAAGSSTAVYPLDNVPLSSRPDFCPYSLIQHVLNSGETINKDGDRIDFITRFEQNYFKTNDQSSAICIPLKHQDRILGALYLEANNNKNKSKTVFDERKRHLLKLFCYQAAVSIYKEKLINKMEIAKSAAEDATAEKASFLANMSHEIRTPFNSLLSFSIFLLDTELTTTQREYVEAIKSSAMITLNIIDGILAFSKIEHGSFTLENAPFSLNDCVESAIELGGEVALSKDIELVFFNNCPDIDTIVGDVTRFRQVVINLVGNAIKFTSAGHVSISCDAKQIDEGRYEIQVAVEDTGIGIPVSAETKVYGAFSQINSSSKREYGGSGLGLAISKRLANIMGGTLRFESEYGVGTTFYLNIGFNASLLPQAPYISHKKCLIYSKHELTAGSLRNMLEYFELNLTVVSDISKIKGLNDFDLIFVDAGLLDDLKDCKTRVILLSRFGIPLSKKMETYDTLMCPFKRSKLLKLLNKKSVVSSKITTVNSTGKLADTYPLRILLAEDNLLNYKVCSKHLEKLGYKADHAKDGIVVLEKCNALLEKNEKYDAILMDIQMPRKDGLSAAIELRESFYKMGKGDSVPLIVALTANVAGDDKQRCLEAGMVDFVSKPILPDELKRVLTKLGEMVNNPQ